MRNVIIFDIGGVLRIYNNNSFNDWIKDTFKVKKNVRPVWKKWQRLLQTDEVNEHEFYSSLLKELFIPESELSEERFYNKLFDDYISDNKQILEFIKGNLYKKYKLYIFSNFSRMEIRKYRKKIDFEKFFDKCIYSCDIKRIKPDIEFFKRALDAIGHQGSECIFFDDQLKNKKNSEKVGIKFIRYVNYDQFIKNLKKLKLK